MSGEVWNKRAARPKRCRLLLHAFSCQALLTRRRNFLSEAPRAHASRSAGLNIVSVWRQGRWTDCLLRQKTHKSHLRKQHAWPGALSPLANKNPNPNSYEPQDQNTLIHRAKTSVHTAGRHICGEYSHVFIVGRIANNFLDSGYLVPFLSSNETISASEWTRSAVSISSAILLRWPGVKKSSSSQSIIQSPDACLTPAFLANTCPAFFSKWRTAIGSSAYSSFTWSTDSPRHLR